MSIGEVRFLYADREMIFDTTNVVPAPLYEKSFPSITSMAIDVSGRCNLRCGYCAESSTMPKRRTMPQEILKKSVDAVFDWSKRGRGISIHMGSGEPLLEPASVFEIARRAKMRADRENRPLALYLTTNGTRFNDAVITQLVREEWNIKVSIDGDAEIHDRYRRDAEMRGTYQSIEKHVITLARTIPERFSTTSVLCHGVDPKQVFESIASMGVKRIELVPVAALPSSPHSLRNSDVDLYRGFMLDYVQKIVDGEDLPTHIRFQNRLRKVLGYRNRRIPCGAGRTFFATGCDGTLYPCFRFIGIQDYNMGSLDTGISIERVQRFAQNGGRSYYERKRCMKCWAAPLCGGPCYACAIFFHSGSPSDDFCEMVRIESKAAIWLANSLREEDPRKLLYLIGASRESAS